MTIAYDMLTWAKRTIRDRLRKYPLLHRTAKEVLVGARVVRHRVRRFVQAGNAELEPWKQSTPRFRAAGSWTDTDGLVSALNQHQLSFAEGRHTIYVPPQAGIEAVLGDMSSSYPADAGFKLLKRFAPPESASYLYESDALGERALMGGIREQANAAAVLAAYELGPRLYDIADLLAGDEHVTVLVNEHVAGRRPVTEEYDRFMSELSALRERGLFNLVNPSGFDCGDFAAPDCNNNLIVTRGGPRYVDPQLFQFRMRKVVEDLLDRHEEVLHFGDVLQVVNKGRRFLYQEIPGYDGVGRRGTRERFAALQRLLTRHGVAIEDRTVFDVCCNSGMVMGECLGHGARWGFGWDLPEVARAANDLLQVLGAWRARVFGTEISDTTDFAVNLPAHGASQDSICFFLAAWHHVGFPPPVAELPWRWLVYEGEEGESLAKTGDNIASMKSRWGCEALETQTMTDGLSGARPVVLLRRER